jgi:ABC-2 type transport system permease protein
MKKIFEVARWEFMEKVKTKTFIISLILTPAILILFSIAPTLLTEQEVSYTKTIGIVDTSGLYINGIKSELSKFTIDRNQPNYLLINLTSKDISLEELKKSADQDVIDEKIEGYLLITRAGTDSVLVNYRSKSLSNLKDIKRFETAFNDTRVKLRLDKENVNPDLLDFISNSVEINQIKIAAGGKETANDFLITFFSSFVFIMLLMMMILYSGGMLIRSLVEEKSNRLIEIIISSCTSNELLTGKILGLSTLGLTQILIWFIIGISLAGTAIVPMSAFSNVFPILIYFILGFVFYTSLFVGIGSIVTSEQEAQQITTYLSFLLVLPIIFVLPALENPDIFYIKILSYIPLTLPSFMMLRLNISPVPIWEILSTILIMLISIYLMIGISSKIFRVGILSYGKRPTLKELMLWLKEK